jgi:uroporphyrinogen-III synthase
MHIIVTRPQPQANQLCKLIKAHNQIPLYLPLIKINPLQLNNKITLNSFDYIIFISQNAVKYGIDYYHQTKRIKTIVIGKKTLKTLADFNIQADIQAPAPYTSEALLSLIPLQQIKNQQFLIIKGEGGREYLKENLLARGAKVQTVDVYQRILLNPSFALLKSIPLANIASIITSGQILEQFDFCLQQANLSPIKQGPLVVISERLQDKAVKLGFKHVLMANSPANQDLINVLLKVAGHFALI